MMQTGGFLIGAFVATYSLTYLIRRYALASNMIDVPNQRSSHTAPTPRGGGIAFVAVFLVGVWALLSLGFLAPNHGWALTGAGAWIAFIGLLDDRSHIPAGWRLLAHLLGAGWGLYWLGGFPPLLVFNQTIDLSWLGHVFGLFYLAWLLNLYNFMDGIDGIAGVEGITTCVGGALLFLLSGNSNLWLEPALLAVATAGFLAWNFPPAKIFMGDAGSGFLGIVLGLMSIQAGWISPQLFWSWLCLLGVFIVDASWTLLQRYRRGEKLHEAHRSHAYQFAARHYGSHKPVTLFVGTVNLLWLLPLALLVGLGFLNGIVGVAISYLPLIVLAVIFHAGSPEKP